MKIAHLKSSRKTLMPPRILMSPSKSTVTRTELYFQDKDYQNWRELNSWLLWAGISPDSKSPMSHIGIYTDFT